MSSLKIKGLADYDVAPLDPRQELKRFRDAVKDAKRSPSAAAAEELCKASRTLAYALHEKKWWLDGGDAAFRRLELAARQAMQDALKLKSSLLAAVPASSRARIGDYFHNIAVRADWLTPEATAV